MDMTSSNNDAGSQGTPGAAPEPGAGVAPDPARTQPLPDRVALTQAALAAADDTDHSGFGPVPAPVAPAPDRPSGPAEVSPPPFRHPAPAQGAAHHVLLDRPGVGWAEVGRRLQDQWGAQVDGRGAEGRLACVVGGVPVTAEELDEPYRASEIEAAARGNRTWREGALVARAQVAQVRVAVDHVTDPVAAHSALSTVAAVVAGDPHAIAVYVPGANRLVDPSSYIDVTGALATGGIPTPNWVTVVATKAEGTGSRGWTRGLAELGHAELEVMRSSRPVTELYSAIGRLADHVLRQGGLYPGDTLTGPDGETITVVAGQSVLYDDPTLKISL